MRRGHSCRYHGSFYERILSCTKPGRQGATRSSAALAPSAARPRPLPSSPAEPTMHAAHGRISQQMYRRRMLSSAGWDGRSTPARTLRWRFPRDCDRCGHPQRSSARQRTAPMNDCNHDVSPATSASAPLCWRARAAGAAIASAVHAAGARKTSPSTEARRPGSRPIWRSPTSWAARAPLATISANAR